MKRNKHTQLAVIGLGRFGGSLVREFHQLGVEVLAVDQNLDKVNDFVKTSTHAVQANSTEEEVLRELGIRNFDFVIVAIGADQQASILTTLLLKELGVKNVWVKAQNKYHHKILEKIGADRIIHPERDMAKRVAYHIVSEKVIDFIELSDEYSIVEVVASKKVANRSLKQLDTRVKYGCTIVAVKSGENITVSPSADVVVYVNDVLVLIGHNNDLKRFEEESL